MAILACYRGWFVGRSTTDCWAQAEGQRVAAAAAASWQASRSGSRPEQQQGAAMNDDLKTGNDDVGRIREAPIWGTHRVNVF